ncbi:hypothetical protein C1646_769369 [Rhizophagus diaphanus]|nr:hypothetical protein C1646_769369 [Rhizophagus diaphanus] [Rhizophagus sp. MUCL 43196]
MERNESEEDEVIVSQRRQTVVLDPESGDYDIEALIAKEMNDDNVIHSKHREMGIAPSVEDFKALEGYT